MDITKSIAIYGKSGHGLVVKQIAQACGYTTVIWIDDADQNDAISFQTFLTQYSNIPVALAIGSNYARKKIYEKVRRDGVHIQTLIHPSAVIAPESTLGEGTVVMPLAVINTHATIGIAAIINTQVCIEHECHIGDFTHLSPNVSIGGATTVGDLTHIGIGTSVIQCIKIGNKSIIGAGSVIINHIPNKVMVAGVPATVRKELS